ncbi:MAG: GDSL-type esterase/lipase family protein, partial [Rubricoccaceae bacterium]|nr:GDSL-type esterase/lipase family protein [Rubricoccaceae bacterium]
MRTVLFISLGFNLLIVACGTYFVLKKGGWGYVKTKYFEIVDGSPHTDPRRPFYESSIYKQDTSIHALVPVQEGDVVFLGDSHAAVGQWSEFFGTTRVKNRGISGDNTEGVLSRLSPILEGNPSAIFLFVGSNDVDKRYNGLSVEQTVENVERIIRRIQAESPRTSVFLMSAPPKSRNTPVSLTET